MPKGLASKGLASKGLVSKGLVSKGLVSKGLVSKGLVSKGLVSRDFDGGRYRPGRRIVRCCPGCPAGIISTAAYDVNVPFMQLERHDWDIHAV